MVGTLLYKPPLPPPLEKEGRRYLPGKDLGIGKDFCGRVFGWGKDSYVREFGSERDG